MFFLEFFSKNEVPKNLGKPGGPARLPPTRRLKRIRGPLQEVEGMEELGLVGFQLVFHGFESLRFQHVSTCFLFE